MKTNNFKLVWLSLILSLLWVVMFSDNSNAAVTNVPVTLAITAGSVDCYNSTGFWAMTWVLSNFAAQAQTGYAGANSWYCNDNKWTALRAGTGIWVMMTPPLSWALGGAIPNVNIKMYAATPTIVNNSTPACTAAGDLTTAGWINIGTPNLYVLRKTWVAWSVCKIQATPIIYVTIPASTPVDTYTWTITVTQPS